MAQASTFDAEASEAFSTARDPARLDIAVIRFHRRMDEVLAASIQGHAVAVACRAGCSSCCSLRVEILPAEAFRLAAWIRRNFSAARVAEVIAGLRENVAATRALGSVEARKHANLPCAMLDDSGRCSVYEARPAQCRRYHSLRLATCEATHADPADDAIESPMHPAVAHNGAVIVTQARQAQRATGLDADPEDFNIAVLEALENPKAWRRWRDGKRAFVGPRRG